MDPDDKPLSPADELRQYWAGIDDFVARCKREALGEPLWHLPKAVRLEHMNGGRIAPYGDERDEAADTAPAASAPAAAAPAAAAASAGASAASSGAASSSAGNSAEHKSDPAGAAAAGGTLAALPDRSHGNWVSRNKGKWTCQNPVEVFARNEFLANEFDKLAAIYETQPGQMWRKFSFSKASHRMPSHHRTAPHRVASRRIAAVCF
jgi:hypothetical protein